MGIVSQKDCPAALDHRGQIFKLDRPLDSSQRQPRFQPSAFRLPCQFFQFLSVRFPCRCTGYGGQYHEAGGNFPGFQMAREALYQLFSFHHLSCEEGNQGIVTVCLL